MENEGKSAKEELVGITAISWVIAAIASLSGLLIGYNTAVIAAALQFIAIRFGLNPTMEGIVVSSVLLGGFIGSILAGWATKRFGERPVLVATAVLFAAGTIGSALAAEIGWLIGWRLVVGLGVGAATMVAPLYVSETAPSRWRGTLVSCIQLAITLGILLSYLAGTLWTPAGWWEAMLGIAAAPAVLMLIGLCFVPESPRWLLHHGRIAAAQRAYRRVTGAEADALTIPLESAAATDAVWRDLFSTRVRPVLILTAGLFAFANLSGIDAILYYAPTIFAQVGIGGTLGPILATSGIGVVNVIATIAAMWLIDRLGRRPLLILGLVPMTLSLVVLSIALGLGQGAAWTHAAAVACLGIFVTGFAISLGPLPYVLMSETFPQALRGPGMGLAAATAWGVNVIVSATFLPLVVVLGMGLVLGLYGLVSAGAVVFVWWMVPETRGRTLELIETNLARGRRVRDLGLPLSSEATR
jgi:MFS transporter, SP family, galactose:H+ symporter